MRVQMEKFKAKLYTNIHIKILTITKLMSINSKIALRTMYFFKDGSIRTLNFYLWKDENF